jgi:murein DD-endopeptidase MepM/ murein hydrolase activator NlpD
MAPHPARALLLPVGLLVSLLALDLAVLAVLAPAAHAVRTPEGAASGSLAAAAPLPSTAARTAGAPRSVDGVPPGAGSWPGSAALGAWPVEPAVVVRGFDPPGAPWDAGHRGIDLAAWPGQQVRSPRAGVVSYAGVIAGRGVVVVAHGDLRSTFEPVATSVALGEAVRSGDPIGSVAAGTGHCGGDPPCLHWGLRRGDAYLDPRLLLDAAAPVLLPP